MRFPVQHPSRRPLPPLCSAFSSPGIFPGQVITRRGREVPCHARAPEGRCASRWRLSRSEPQPLLASGACEPVLGTDADAGARSAR